MNSSKTNLMTASREWAERPADQRFWSLKDMVETTQKYREESRVQLVDLAGCEVVPLNTNSIGLMGPAKSRAARFQHFSFGQLSQLLGAPTADLRTLPPGLVCSRLNYGISQLDAKEQNMMFRKNGDFYLRCITGAGYQRIWDHEVGEMALRLQEEHGWRTPPARPCGLPDIPTRTATQDDVLRNSAHPGLGIKVGDEISPAGIYASDHDCFIFQVNEDRPITVGGETLYRGVFWSNSEVGTAKFKGTLFLYDSVCGNHIVWGAKVIAEIEIRHTGRAREWFSTVEPVVQDYIDKSAADDVKRIEAARKYLIADTKEEVITKVFGKALGLSRSECEQAYTVAEVHSETHGDPKSAWGFASGVTRISQQSFADKRNQMDRAAGRLLEWSF